MGLYQRGLGEKDFKKACIPLSPFLIFSGATSSIFRLLRVIVLEPCVPLSSFSIFSGARSSVSLLLCVIILSSLPPPLFLSPFPFPPYLPPPPSPCSTIFLRQSGKRISLATLNKA